MDFFLSEVNYEGVCLIQIEGFLQGDDSTEAFRALFDRRVKEGIRYFVIDISKLNYIASAGLRELVGVRARLSLRVSKCCFILPAVGETKEVLEATGFFQLLQKYATLEEAFSEFLGKPVNRAEIVSKLEKRLSIDASGRIMDEMNLLGKNPPLAEKQESAAQLHKIKIFLASSAELREDRDEFEIYFRQLNDELLREAFYLEITRWENFLDAMSETRLQDEYNQAIKNCDIFVSLFSTKTGKFTEEEFNTAYQQFKDTGKPLIYTYFKGTMINVNDLQEDDLLSLLAFKKRLKDLGHFYTPFANTEDLKLKFRTQLDKLLEGPLRQ
jgi:anti-anti-sigma factor